MILGLGFWTHQVGGIVSYKGCIETMFDSNNHDLKPFNIKSQINLKESLINTYAGIFLIKHACDATKILCIIFYEK